MVSFDVSSFEYSGTNSRVFLSSQKLKWPLCSNKKIWQHYMTTIKLADAEHFPYLST